MQHAIIKNYFPIVVALFHSLPVEHRKAALLKKCNNGCNTLEVAIKGQSLNIVKALLAALSHEERIEAIMTEDEEGDTLLTTAVHEEQGENKV